MGVQKVLQVIVATVACVFLLSRRVVAVGRLVC